MPSNTTASPVTPDASPIETDIPTSAPSESATGESFPGDEDDFGDASPTPPQLNPTDAGRVLTLRDVRNADELSQEDFADDTYKVGNRPVTAIGGLVRACGNDARPVQLDLRPAAQFKTLSFSVGQDAERTATGSTNQVLVAQVLGNDDEVLAIGRAKITSPTKLSADISGVVAAQIRLYLDERQCSSSNSVVAVLSELKLQ